MNAKAYLLDDDRGVSPVIGVILMVAITVILAAVIATFVMNMGPSDSGPPNAQLEWVNTTDSSDNVVYEMSHTGGDALPVGEYVIEIDHSGGTEEIDLGSEYTASEEMTAGDTFTIGVGGLASSISSDTSYDASGPLTVGDISEVTLIWENPNNDQTQVIREWSP